MEYSLKETRDELKEIFDELDSEYRSLNNELLSITEQIKNTISLLNELKDIRKQKELDFKKQLETLLKNGREYNELKSDIDRISKNIVTYNENQLRNYRNDISNYKNYLGFQLSIKRINIERVSCSNDNLEDNLNQIDKELKNIINMFNIVNIECNSNLK